MIKENFPVCYRKVFPLLNTVHPSIIQTNTNSYRHIEEVITQNDPWGLFPVRFCPWFCSLILFEYISAMIHFVSLPVVFPTEQVACTSRTLADTQLRSFARDYLICFLKVSGFFFFFSILVIRLSKTTYHMTNRASCLKHQRNISLEMTLTCIWSCPNIFMRF